MTVIVLMSLDSFCALFICRELGIVGFTFVFFLLQCQQRVKWCITSGGIGNQICHALNFILLHVDGID